MGRIHAGGADIFVDEFDYSGVVNSILIDVDNPVADITAFEDTDFTCVEGKPKFTITLNGLYSTASPAYDGEMFADLTSGDRLITISPIASATGGSCYFGQGNISTMPEIATLTDAVALHVTWDGDKPLCRGTIMYRGTALTTTTNGTAYQLGAISTSQQLIAFQHVLSSGTGTLDTIVKSDDEEAFGGTPSTQITFTQASATTSERKTKAGAITDDWYRVEMTVAGASPSFNVIIVLGITSLNA